MADVFTEKKRSRVMAAIRSSENKATELKLISIFRAHGISGWRRRRIVHGRPDFVFPSQRLAIFVDGCFWHGCRHHCRMPKSRLTYWGPKIQRNKVRDREVNRVLKGKGWKVIRIWEHSLKTPDQLIVQVKAVLDSKTGTALQLGRMNGLDIKSFELLLSELCNRLSNECKSGRKYEDSKTFEQRVRDVIGGLLEQYGVEVDSDPHPYGFPDIALGEFGVEVKFTTNDTWRSVANSVFEGFRDKNVKYIYVVYGKMGGIPAVRFRKYDESVIHVRTSHVPRFELDMEATTSLFEEFGVTYDQFSNLSEEERMKHVRKYATKRLNEGEMLWWLGGRTDESHSVPLQAKLYTSLEMHEKRQLRAEASLLFPEIVKSSRSRSKYSEVPLYILTYHGVLCHQARDLFTAGSVAGPQRGGNYMLRALQNIEAEMREAAQRLDDALFKEYWKRSVPPERRIKEWLKRADGYASECSPPWKPSEVLFLNSTKAT